MNCIGLMTATLICYLSIAQDVGKKNDAVADASLIESNQKQITQLAERYSIDMKHGDWTRQQVPICPIFTRHVFVRYQRNIQVNVWSSFLAIVPRNGGRIRLVRFPRDPNGETLPVATRDSTIAVFNAVWLEELSNTSKGTFPPRSLTWVALAQCYASIAGERIMLEPISSPATDSPIDLIHPISRVVIPVTSGDSISRSVSLGITPKGLVGDVEVRTNPIFK